MNVLYLHTEDLWVPACVYWNNNSHAKKVQKFIDICHRSNRSHMFYKIGTCKNLVKFTGKHLRWSLFLNKIAGWGPVTLLKRRLWHRCFLVNFAKFSGTFFLQNNLRRLLWWIKTIWKWVFWITLLRQRDKLKEVGR